MSTGFPKWDFSTIDHRGHWVQKLENCHWLSDYATMGAYHRERETEGMPEDQVSLIDVSYPLIRYGRSIGFLDLIDHVNVSGQVHNIAAEACRSEGIPVIQDYPISMHNAIRSYGRLLASLYCLSFGALQNINKETEKGWAAILSHAIRLLGNWDVQVVDESYRGIEIRVPTSAIESSEDTRKEEAEKIIDSFNQSAHIFPNLLQSFLVLSDHLGLKIPTVYPVHQPTVELWSAIDVTSTNFLQTLAAQPGLFKMMSGYQFEKTVAEIFKRNGFTVISTKRSRDGGYDLRIIVPVISKMKIAFLVECKNPKSGKPVSVSVIRGLKGISDKLRSQTAGGIVVTSTKFSPEARKEAEASGWGVTLFDRRDLLELLETAERVTE